ncbi:MAG TPA: hypothetical protein VGT60_10635 [Candidatus Limnocylindria bacterium]|nr:hypothetical protein [Candidatus Limnocylindria bacterium]
MRPYRVAYEHPTQLLASTFLRALALDDGARVWERLSRESRGLLEGRYAAGARIALHRAASIEADGGDARLAEVVAPVRASALAVLGGPEQLLALGVSAARLVDRGIAYVLLLPDFGEERIVAEAEWRPRHLLAFVHESRDWLVDLGRTAELSADAETPDPLGLIR